MFLNKAHATKMKGKFDRFLLVISTFIDYFRGHKCQTPVYQLPAGVAKWLSIGRLDNVKNLSRK